MSFVQYRIRAEKGFKDGQILSRRLRVGEEAIVDEQTYSKMRQSDPEGIILLEKVVPNPVKKTKGNGS